MDDAESDPRNIEEIDGEHKLWTKQNGHLSWKKPKPNWKSHNAKEEGDDEQSKYGFFQQYDSTTHSTKSSVATLHNIFGQQILH